MLLKEMDSRNPIGRVYVDQTMRNQYLLMQSRLPQAEAYTASAGTIVAGAESFNLPTASSAEYAGDFRIRLQSDGRYLQKATADEMERMKYGHLTNTGLSRSTWFQPVEGATQTVTCYVWPLNQQTETYDLWRAMVADDFSATDVAATVLNIGRYAQDALVFKTAAAILMAMSGSEAEARGLDKNVAGKWDRDGEVAIYQAAAHGHDIESVGHIQRLVS